MCGGSFSTFAQYGNNAAGAHCSKLAGTAYQLAGNRHECASRIGLRKNPDVLIARKINRVCGLITLNGERVYGASINTGAAQDARIGHTGSACRTHALNHNATRGAGAYAAAAANTCFGIYYQAAHLFHPLNNLRYLRCRACCIAFKVRAVVFTLGYKRAHYLRG